MSRMMHDVVIIGGGPAGLYAGARLAAVGLRAALLEEHASVGEPVHCTGVLAADAFDEFNLPRRSILNQLKTARFTSPAGHEVIYAGERVEAVVIDRRAFDQDLLERALSAGVAIDGGSRATGVQVDADGVTVTTPTSEYRARACILACGAK
jgi:digeranylgeranylglycerophospholipid reductase